MLGAYLADNVRARRMRSDGTFERIRPVDEEPAVDAQARLLAEAARTVVGGDALEGG